MRNLKHCLIIDDDTDDQEIFMLCMNAIDSTITCTTANNGVEAVKLLEANPNYQPGYIFIDMNMPKMNGLECLKRIKGMERLSQSKVYIYSTTSEKVVVKESKDLGADDFIVKPTKIFDIKARLAQIFE